MTRWPDFFIVGAPKAGTTALYSQLRQHPQVFLPEFKEPTYFGSDLDAIGARVQWMSRARYLRLFERARDDQVVGEASTLYLVSRDAPFEIAAAQPTARIIVMLRDPVDMLVSLHSQLLRNGLDVPRDFSEALARDAQYEAARREGRPTPIPLPMHRAYVRYGEQLTRYFSIFPPEQIHLVFYEDFNSDPQATFENVCRFIRVSTRFRPERVRVNERGLPKNNLLRRCWYGVPWETRQRIKRWIPFDRPAVVQAYVRLQGAFSRWTTQVAPPITATPLIRAQLIDELRADIEQLEKLVGRDLSAWRSLRS